jgi:hypothetical protein
MIQFLPRKEIFHHSGIFSGRYPIPRQEFSHHDGIFPVIFPLKRTALTGLLTRVPLFGWESSTLTHIDHKAKDIEESTKGQGHRRHHKRTGT